MSQFIIFVAVYMIGAVATAGYYLRHASWKLRNGTVVAVTWPAYWLLVHGISGTAIILIRSVFSIAQEILNGLVTLVFKDPDIWLFAYATGVFITPGVIFYHRASACHAVASCAGVLASSIGWGLIWPSYVLATLIFAS